MSPTILLLNNSLSQVNISSSTVIEEDKDESNNISGLNTIFTIIGVLTTVIFIGAVSLKRKNNKKNNNIKIEENTGNLMYNHFNSCNMNNSSKYDNQYLQPTLIDTTYSDILYSSDNIGYEIPNYNISDENYNNLYNSNVEFDSSNVSDNQMYDLGNNNTEDELIEDNNLYDLAANNNHLYNLANNYIDIDN